MYPWDKSNFLEKNVRLPINSVFAELHFHMVCENMYLLNLDCEQTALKNSEVWLLLCILYRQILSLLRDLEGNPFSLCLLSSLRLFGIPRVENSRKAPLLVLRSVPGISQLDKHQVRDHGLSVTSKTFKACLSFHSVELKLLDMLALVLSQLPEKNRTLV